MSREEANRKHFEKHNKILVLAEEKDLSEPCFASLEQQGDVYLAKSIQDGVLHLTFFVYHLICISVKNLEYVQIGDQLIETIRRVSEIPILIVIPETLNLKSKLIHAGADTVLNRKCSAEELNLQVYALIRAYKRWKTEKKEITDITVGMLTINALQRKVYCGEKRV